MDDNDENNSTVLGIEEIKNIYSRGYSAVKAAASFIKPDMTLLEVAEKIEKSILDEGFNCAFPINLSINSEAAHYTPSFQDSRTFNEKDVVKVDFGIEKYGIMSDCAVTVDLSNEHSDLVEASKEAVEAALSVIRKGVEVRKIGEAIENTIKKRNLIPIKNLGGHGIGIYDLHSSPFIPNFDNNDDTRLEEGMTIAIEPFVTNGKKGMVIEGDTCEIYQLEEEAIVRSQNARKLMNKIIEKYKNEPFAVRWLANSADSKFNLYSGISEIFRAGALSAYPVLVEQSGGLVAQTEVDVIVGSDSCILLTK
ncbi:MAG: type II methionyl aminopeptidase [Candidatus Micrarchaeia archaeon]